MSALHNAFLAITYPVGASSPGPDGASQRGTEQRTWGPANFQSAASSEALQGQHTVTGEFFASGPLAQWIVEGSTVVLGPTTYRVKGLPKHFTSGVLDHTELTLVMQKG